QVPAAASAEESAAAESLPESLAESCSGSEAPHPASSTRARAAKAACSMRASDVGGWIRAWERLCAGWSMPSSYSRPTTGRVRMLLRPTSIRTRPPLERCLVETTAERRDHCARPGGASRQRRSVETTARALCVRLSCDSYLTILAGREVCYVF